MQLIFPKDFTTLIGSPAIKFQNSLSREVLEGMEVFCFIYIKVFDEVFCIGVGQFIFDEKFHYIIEMPLHSFL